MATNNGPSAKQALIDKANTRIVAYVGIAAFVLVFSLVATKTLISQANYQNRIIGAKRTAVNQLKKNITATNELKTNYTAFISTPQNVLGGNTNGTAAMDGNNAKVVLDALPSSYDFPGLTTSLDALLSGSGMKLNGITGTDDEVAQSTNQTSVNPVPVPIPFSVSVTGDYTAVQAAVTALGASIRPMQIQAMDLAGGASALTLNVTAQTFYQPAKSLSITKQVVK